MRQPEVVRIGNKDLQDGSHKPHSARKKCEELCILTWWPGCQDAVVYNTIR